MNYQQMVCVVTGASSGIGRVTALDLAARGAKVCVAARRQDRLAEVVSAMGGDGAGHSYVVTDVGKRSDVRALEAHVRSTYGRCDVLVNNAGFSREVPLDEPGGVEALEAVMATNFFGAVYCTAEFLPLLLESAPSHVVNVASVAGRLASAGTPAYCASKFALVGWSEALHYDLADRGVYVSLVEPGFVSTEGFPQEDLVGNPMLRRIVASPEEVAIAIRHAISNRKQQRVVPRYYYLFQIPRLLAPPIFRWAQERLVKPRHRARQASH
jgi:uncharacterized protein